jgi:exoribonuclease R
MLANFNVSNGSFETQYVTRGFVQILPGTVFIKLCSFSRNESHLCISTIMMWYWTFSFKSSRVRCNAVLPVCTRSSANNMSADIFGTFFADHRDV